MSDCRGILYSSDVPNILCNDSVVYEILTEGIQGPPGPPGPPGPVVLTWEFLAVNWSSEPVLVGTITGGSVYSYTLNSITRYRFVPSVYVSSQDCFYSNFDGLVLTGLICSRG